MSPAASRPLAVSRRLRVAVLAADNAAAERLAALVIESGNDPVTANNTADVVLTDGSAPAGADLPAVAIGAAEADFAGWLPAEASPAQLDAALRAVAVGLTIRPRPRPLFGPLPEQPSPTLTPRELDVLTGLADGLSNKVMARRLGISPHTVKFHIEQLFHKLGARCRAEAVAKGLKQQIVEL